MNNTIMEKIDALTEARLDREFYGEACEKLSHNIEVLHTSNLNRIAKDIKTLKSHRIFTDMSICLEKMDDDTAETSLWVATLYEYGDGDIVEMCGADGEVIALPMDADTATSFTHLQEWYVFLYEQWDYMCESYVEFALANTMEARNLDYESRETLNKAYRKLRRVSRKLGLLPRAEYQRMRAEATE